MKAGKLALPTLILAVGVFLIGFIGDSNSGARNRPNDAMSGTSDAMKSSGDSELDRHSRPGSETGMNSGNRTTTRGGTSWSGTERANRPRRANR